MEGGMRRKEKKTVVVAEQSIAKLCSKRYYRDLDVPAVGGVAGCRIIKSDVIGREGEATWAELSGQGQVTVMLSGKVKAGNKHAQGGHWMWTITACVTGTQVDEKTWVYCHI
jgi:hypothetical protein